MRIFADKSFLLSFSGTGAFSIAEQYIPEKSFIAEVVVSSFVNDNSSEYFASFYFGIPDEANYFAVSGSSKNTGRGFIVFEKGKTYMLHLDCSGQIGVAIAGMAYIRPIQELPAP